MSTEQNKATYRRFVEDGWNKGDLAVLDEISLPGLVLHFLPPGTPPGAETMKRFMASFRVAFPDVSFVIKAQIAEADTVVGRWTMSGTHSGPYHNDLRILMPPTGKRFSAEGIDIWRFDSNGKWAECWSSFDRLGRLQQLGAILATEPNPSQATQSTLAAALRG